MEFELPDERIIKVGDWAGKVPEILFNPAEFQLPEIASLPTLLPDVVELVLADFRGQMVPQCACPVGQRS